MQDRNILTNLSPNPVRNPAQSRPDQKSLVRLTTLYWHEKSDCRIVWVIDIFEARPSRANFPKLVTCSKRV